MDLALIGLNNQAKLEGISYFDDKAKVKFIGINDSHQTPMCRSLDGQEFYIHDWNEFERYSKTADSIVKKKCYGLVQGLNLPPVDDGFHWCRSYIEYLPVEKRTKSEYNGLASNETNTVENHPKPKLLEKIDYNNEKQVIETIKKYEEQIKNESIENAIVVTKNGNVYQCYGKNNAVWPDNDLKDELKEAYVTHNHPKKETQYSFSEDDVTLFNNYNLKRLRGVDDKYTYELNRDSKEIDEVSIEDLMGGESEMHGLIINRASRMNIGYRRWKND